MAKSGRKQSTKFECQYLVIADQIQEGVRGKLNILGVFDQLWIEELPTVYPAFVAVFLLAGKNEDALGQHRLVVRVRRPDGRITAEAAGDFHLAAGPNPYGHASLRGIVGLQGVKFFEGGKHVVDLEVDGEAIAAHPFQLHHGKVPG